MTQLFPVLNIPGSITLRVPPSADFGKNPVFDFNNGTFLLNPNGTFIITEGKNSLPNLIRKALVTPRGKLRIYSKSYGSELDALIQKKLTHDEAKLEIERLITEALIYDRRILRVYDFEIEVDNDQAVVDFKVDSIWGSSQELEILL